MSSGCLRLPYIQPKALTHMLDIGKSTSSPDAGGNDNAFETPLQGDHVSDLNAPRAFLRAAETCNYNVVHTLLPNERTLRSPRMGNSLFISFLHGIPKKPMTLGKS